MQLLLLELLILLPALDLDVLLLHLAEGIDEGACQTCVGDQWDIVVDRRTTDLIAVGQLTLAVILRDVDYQLKDMLAEHLHDVVVALLIRPANGDRRDLIVI